MDYMLQAMNRRKLAIVASLLIGVTFVALVACVLNIKSQRYYAGIQTDSAIVDSLSGTWKRAGSETLLVLNDDGTGYFDGMPGRSKIDWACDKSEFRFVEYGDPAFLNLARIRRIATTDTSMQKKAEIVKLTEAKMELAIPGISDETILYTRQENR